jgi:hypothetical protein
MPKTNAEIEKVRATVSRLTGADFEVTDVRSYLPGVSLKAEWFLACQEITQANKIPYINTLWRAGTIIRMESLTLGNTSKWIEEDYGEEGAISVLDEDLSDFGNPKVREEILEPFPNVKRRIDLQENVIRRIAEKDHVNLEVRYSGGKGLSTFYLDSMVDASKGDVEYELKVIEKSLKSMKEAWRQVIAL